MNDHTPGPWHSIKQHTFVEGSSGSTAVSTDMGHHVAEVVADHYGTAMPDAANAHLIAAAPDMLEALRAATRLTDYIRQHKGWLDEEHLDEWAGEVGSTLAAAIATATEEDANR